MDDLIQRAGDLRSLYAPRNKVGVILDELMADLREGNARQAIINQAQDIQSEIPGSTAAAMIRSLVLAIQADQ